MACCQVVITIIASPNSNKGTNYNNYNNTVIKSNDYRVILVIILLLVTMIIVIVMINVVMIKSLPRSIGAIAFVVQCSIRHSGSIYFKVVTS